MKFPVVTVTLVSAALLYVLWDQSQEPPAPLDPSQFANLAAEPVERGRIVDWAVSQVPQLCEEATGAAVGASAHAECLEASRKRESSCRRAAADQFPALVATEAGFRDLAISTMNCLVPQSARL